VKRVHRLAYVDMVTELPNRERFRKEVERVTREAGESGYEGAILFLDLDRFKRVNDSLGIGEGDRLLEAVGRRLREAARGWDLSNGVEGAEPSMVARLGGDEFTVLMPKLRDGTDAARLARRIIDAVRRPFEISGHQVFLGISAGAAVFPRDGSDPETLLRHADLAMAMAKRNGGNACEFFETQHESERLRAPGAGKRASRSGSRGSAGRVLPAQGQHAWMARSPGLRLWCAGTIPPPAFCRLAPLSRRPRNVG
jgi:diguanylate cyclase (GGDEF)-like protein